MRTIETTTVFRRDFRREKSGRHRKDVVALVESTISLLANDVPLPVANRDHALAGEWKDHRECHLKPNLLLVSRKPSPRVLQLVRLGSHSELFG